MPGMVGSGTPGRPGMVGAGCANAVAGIISAMTITPTTAARRRVTLRPEANLLVDTVLDPNFGDRLIRSPKARINSCTHQAASQTQKA